MQYVPLVHMIESQADLYKPQHDFMLRERLLLLQMSNHKPNERMMSRITFHSFHSKKHQAQQPQQQLCDNR